VAALLVEDDDGPKWLLANLGDSRAYRFAEGALEQVSIDHSVVQELIDAGEITATEAGVHPERHMITRALGVSADPEADYFLLPLPTVERLVLCSDGVSGMVEETLLAEILAGEADPRDAADRMVAAAIAAGGEDNATVVIVDVVGLVAESEHDAGRQPTSLEEKPGALP
jgi:serine/threonine protein phosphatase PrpC